MSIEYFIKKMRTSFVVSTLVFAVFVVLINLFVPNPTFKKLEDKANFEIGINQPELAEQTLIEILQNDSFNIEYHHKYINVHFDIPETKKIGRSNIEHRNDQQIQDYYRSLTQSTDQSISDIGLYGQGLIEVQFKNYESAILTFQKVRNKDLLYLNNSLGNAYLKLQNKELAEKYFRKEITRNGNLIGAFSNLTSLLLDQGRIDELITILRNPQTKQFFPSRVERELYFISFQPFKYVKILIKYVFSGINLFGVIAALIILCIWVIYLQKIDIFEPEKWNNIILTVVLGMILSLITFPLSDMNNLIFNFKLNGELLNDFLYCVLGIGAVEELSKIVPLFLILRFTNAVNEPFDYIKYASLSALGFAFIENISYFGENQLQIISGRALTATVSHMFDSSIIAYGLLLNKYKNGKNPILNFLIFYFIASLTHGFYDFWLINETVSDFKILTFLFLLVSIYVWNSIINNSLNNSTFFDKDTIVNKERLNDYLIYSLSCVLLFEYIATSLSYGPKIANNSTLLSIYSSVFLLFFISNNLGQFSLIKGKWASIRYFEIYSKSNFENLVDTPLKILNYTHNESSAIFLPNSGVITKRLTVSKELDWFLVKLDDSRNSIGFVEDLVLIRTKKNEDRIERGTKTFVAFYLIPKNLDLDKKRLKRTDFKFCGWAIAE